MHQLQHASAWAGLAQLLDHAKAHATAAMHRDTCGLVDGQHVLVFHQQGEFPPRGDRRMGIRCGDANWGNTHHIASLHSAVRAGTALVDPHLASADDAIHMGFGHAF